MKAFYSYAALLHTSHVNTATVLLQQLQKWKYFLLMEESVLDMAKY